MKKFLMAIFMFSFLIQFNELQAEESLDETGASVCEIDQSPPRITGPDTIYYEIGAPEPNYDTIFQVEDDCSVVNKLSIHKGYQNLNTPGSYKVSLFATDGQVNASNEKVNIEVLQSITKPAISGLSNKIIEVNSDLTEDFLLEGVVATDFRGEDLTEFITIDSSAVKLNEVGVYTVYYRVQDTAYTVTGADTAYQVTEQQISVEVQESITIELKDHAEKITIDVNEDINDYEAYFNNILTIKDNFNESKLDIRYTYSQNIKDEKVGSYELTVDVTDSDKHSQTFKTIVEVVDTTPPVITGLKDYVYHIEAGENKPNFFEGVVVNDTYYGEIASNKIVIDTKYVQYDQEGIYPVYYSVSDKSGNLTTEVRYITVIDDAFPSINHVKPIVMTISKLNEPRFDLLQGISASYNGKDITNQIEVDDSNVDYTTIGTYYITYYVNDLGYAMQAIEGDSRVITTITIEEDSIAPEVQVEDSIDIEVHTKPETINFYDYIRSLSDNYNDNEELDITIEKSVNFNVIGTYLVKYVVKDVNGNLVEKIMDVHIVDTTEASASVTGPIMMEVKGTVVNYMDYITVHDNYWTNEDIHISIDDSKVNYDHIGNYTVTYTVTDESNNEVVKEVQVKIVDTTAPVISGVTDRETKEGRDINILEGILAMDAYEGNITHKIMTIGDYDFDEEGTYTVYYKVVDSSGNEAIQSFVLTVHNNPTPLIVKIILSSCGIFVLGFYIFTKIQERRMKDWM